VPVSDFIDHFADWIWDWFDVPALIRNADTVFENPMIDRDPVPTWRDGQVALLGDAAHAMLPFAAQGAGMAIEDAAVLAQCLSESPGNSIAGIPATLKRYGRLRRGRVLRVQRAARRQGRIYHLTGPLALARDLAIKAMGPERMLARQDWIYDWRV